MSEIETKPSLGVLAWLIGLNANWVIGGGTATIEVLRRSLTRRGWMTDADHQSLFAASRVTPGTNLLAYCTAAGWRVRRGSGAVVALLAASVPCAIMAVIAIALYDRLEASPTFAIVVTLGMTVALILLGLGAWQLGRPQLTRAKAARSIVIVVLAVALGAVGVTPIWVLLIAAVIGALWP
jgi:chromate transporter